MENPNFVEDVKPKVSEQPPSLYSNFQPHIDRVDFDREVFKKVPQVLETNEDYVNAKAAADDITAQILGLPESRRMEYWSDPKYKITLKNGTSRQMTPLEIEIKILRDAGRDGWAHDSAEGKPCYIHGLTALKIIFPDTDITPPLADITQLSMCAFYYRRKFLNLLGSMDAGKSSSGARLAFLYMLIDVEHTFVIVANPLLDSADSTILGDITELYGDLAQAHPHAGNPEVPYMFPKSKVDMRGRITFLENGRGKGGWMALRSLKKQGVFIGSKGKGSDPRRGVGLMILDEVNRVERFESLADLPNVARQSYFQMITTQNPRDPADFGGQMCEPKKWGDWGVSSHDDVTEDMVIWPTGRSGIAYRLDGLDSVNVRLNRQVYPYLVTPQKVSDTETDYGSASPEYRSQVRAMFSGAQDINTVISRAKVAGSRYDDEWYSFTTEEGRGMFCDPAHSVDGDNAVLQTFRWGKGIVRNIDGTQIETPLIEFDNKPTYLRLIDGPKWTEESQFWQRLLNLGLDPSKMPYGKDITYEEQLAVQMAEVARLRGIPPQNIGYDFSMRPEMVSAVHAIFGRGPEPFNYNQKPFGYQLVSTPEDTADICAARTDELAKLAADALISRQVRGGKNIRLALQQLSDTRLDEKKTKFTIEKKPDFKARHANKSPDERDVFMGAIGIARMRGWQINQTHIFDSSRQGGSSTLSRLLKSAKGRAKTAARLPY